MNEQSMVQQQCLLQEGVSCALATLRAIDGADLLSTLPTAPGAAARHNHGMALLNMLEDHLLSLQREVDGLAEEATARSEGR